MCGKKMKAYIPTKYSYKEVTVTCGSTAPSGYPYLCDKCEVIHAGRDWRQEARENGEAWDEDEY